MFLRLRNLKLRPLLSCLIVTLAYPVIKAVSAADSKLLIFTDTVTIMGLVLLIGGVVYSFVLHGDLDVSAFILRRGMRGGSSRPFDAYMADIKEKREEAFNYPLFLGVLYLAAAAVLAYGFL